MAKHKKIHTHMKRGQRGSIRRPRVEDGRVSRAPIEIESTGSGETRNVQTCVHVMWFIKRNVVNKYDNSFTTNCMNHIVHMQV